MRLSEKYARLRALSMHQEGASNDSIACVLRKELLWVETVLSERMRRGIIPRQTHGPKISALFRHILRLLTMGFSYSEVAYAYALEPSEVATIEAHWVLKYTFEPEELVAYNVDGREL